MKNYKVKSLIDNFNDLVENVKHNKGDVFYCTEERCKLLVSKNYVELIAIEIEEDEYNEILENENSELTNEEIGNIKEEETIEVIVNKKFEEKPKKKKNK